MKLGLLADIDEQTNQLRDALAVLKEHGAERFVVLGDVFEMGKRMGETVALLQEVEAVGVWGNHDFGLCIDSDEWIRKRYSLSILRFMGSLQATFGLDVEQTKVEVCCPGSADPGSCLGGLLRDGNDKNPSRKVVRGDGP